MSVHLIIMLLSVAMLSCSHGPSSESEASSGDDVEAAGGYSVVCQFRPLGVTGRWEINLHRGVGPVFDKFCIVGSEQEYAGLTNAQILELIEDEVVVPESGWRYECPRE